MTSQFLSLQMYSKERSNYSGPPDIMSSLPSDYQPCVRSEFQDVSPSSVPGRGPSRMTNAPMGSELVPPFESPPYLTGSAPESDGATFSFPSHLQPHPYFGMISGPPMQPSFSTALPSYPDGDYHRREIPIAVDHGQGIVSLSNMEPPFPAHASSSYSVYLPDGSIPGAHHSQWYARTSPSESTGDACSPTALHSPHVQRTSLYHTFIDGSPLLKQAHDQVHNLAKGTVASYSILKASEARRRNHAGFTCEYCQATFTRSHNLSYHLDSHLGIKKHNSLCGKKFGTPSGSKRHQGTCSKCKGTSTSRDTLSPG